MLLHLKLSSRSLVHYSPPTFVHHPFPPPSNPLEQVIELRMAWKSRWRREPIDLLTPNPFYLGLVRRLLDEQKVHSYPIPEKRPRAWKPRLPSQPCLVSSHSLSSELIVWKLFVATSAEVPDKTTPQCDSKKNLVFPCKQDPSYDYLLLPFHPICTPTIVSIKPCVAQLN